MIKIARDAFANDNFEMAAEIFERCLYENYHFLQHQLQSPQSTQNVNCSTLDLHFWYGDALARSGRLLEAFDVYLLIANNMCEPLPIDRLKHLAISLVESVIRNRLSRDSGRETQSPPATMGSATTININSTSTMYRRQQSYDAQHQSPQQSLPTQHQQYHGRLQGSTYSTVAKMAPGTDLLLCSICDDILRCPVTAPCGHTFCKQCCSAVAQCNLCGTKFPGTPTSNNGLHYLHHPHMTNSVSAGQGMAGSSTVGLKADVLIRRLVDKWWPHDLQARDLNDDAVQFLSKNELDDALKCSNESLEKSPNNYKSLLVRSEVLYRLRHYQSSLADADNALKTRPISAKAYHRRALALSGLGRNEEALISQCLAASLDKNMTFCSSVSFRNEICRLLQRIVMPSMRSGISGSFSSAPYSVVVARRRRRRRLMHVSETIGTSDCEEANSSCGEDDHFVHNTHRYSRRMSSIASESILPRPNARLRTLLDRIQQEVQKIRRVEQKTVLLQVSPAQVDVSDFDCVLCCRTLWRPVVTPCGHTYCWVCLDRCMDYSSSCPLCMSPLTEHYKTSYRGSSTPVPFSLAKKSVTKFLEVAMQRFIPEWYEKRKRQEIELEPSVPVFICTTAFPQVPCPLFVYEPRYRLMVRRAIESGERQFGIVQPHTGKSRYSDVGTMLDIRDCVLLGDGCSILSTVGCRRFRILSRDEKDGYETAKVEYIYDEPIAEGYVPVVSDMHAHVLNKATNWYESLTTDIKEEILRSFGPMPQLEQNWETIADGPAWAWWIIAILPLNQQLKVNILATTSLEKRLRAIDKTLDYITGKQRQQNCVVVQCEGLPACQAIECCQRTVATSSTTPDDHQNAPETTDFML